MQERERIISFLLESCDEKNRVIAELQAKLAAQEKEIESLKPKEGKKKDG